MTCPRCRAANETGARFCEQCGARLELACPSCGSPVGSTSKFCRACGTALTEEWTRAASPESYTPPHLVEKILTSRAALEGERKHVTVLFADLKGSMELLADRDPEDARTLLDPVLERMMEAVHRYEGTVNQVMGDGIMALFGAPLAHEDHAVRACYAALRMQASLSALGEDVLRAQGIPIQVRIGLNSGEVVVRSVGSDLRMDYTAVGQTTHLAARMEQIARHGSILVTADTLQLAEGYIDVKPLGPVPVKGVSQPVEVYEIVGTGPIRRRMQAMAMRSLSRFVGRSADLEQVHRASQQAGNGQGQIVAVAGEPGVGKSRLFAEFTRSHHLRSWLVLETGALSYGQTTPYLPVVEVLKSYFQIGDDDDHRQIRERITGKLLTLDRALAPSVPVILALLAVPVDDETWAALDPRQRRQQTLDALKRLLISESLVQPVVLVVEDLHWIDGETQAFLDSLVESLPTSRVLLLVNYRPEYQHTWGRKAYCTQLRIDPLPAASAEELLQALLGSDPGLGPLKARLIERTEGNPFFLEESVRGLVETGELAGERGAYRMANAVPSLLIPATAQALLAARIDRLSPTNKRVLQAASVIGKDVPLALLQAVADEGEEVLRRALGELQATEFLYETRLFPDVEYTFKHALTHEVTYGTLLHDRRRALHARIAHAIEELYRDRLGEQVERLAHHAVNGDVRDKAVAYLREAGTKAFMRSAIADAIAYLTKSLEVIPTLPADPDRDRQELATLLALGPVLQSTQGFGAADVEPVYTRARELGERCGEPLQVFQAAWGLWMFSTGRGQMDVARRIADELLVLAERSGEDALLLEAHHALWASVLWLGDPLAARRHVEQGLALYDRDRHRSHAFLYGGHDPGVCCRMHWGLALWVLGYPDQALENSNAAVALAEQIAHPHSQAMALHWACAVHQLRRDRRAMAGPVRTLIDLSTEQGFAHWRAGGVMFEAWALADAGEGDTERIRRSFAALQGIAGAFRVPVFTAILADAYLKQGHSSEGLRAVDETLATAVAQQERLWESELRRLRGELLLARSPSEHDEAERCFRQALEIARRQSARSWEVRAATSLGRLLGRQGRREEARLPLAEVYGWFTEGLDTEDLRDARALLEMLGS